MPGLEYVVTDIETTSLDPTLDEIIEFAAVGLTRDLETELFRLTFPVAMSEAGRARLMSNDYVREMHATNGLLADLDKPGVKTLPEVEQIVLDEMAKHRQPKQKPSLAGSGVSHMEARFFPIHMPRFFDATFYSTADAGVMRRFYFRQTGRMLTDIDQSKTHRALDDVDCHIEELKAFRDVFRTHAGLGPVSSG